MDSQASRDVLMADEDEYVEMRPRRQVKPKGLIKDYDSAKLPNYLKK